MEQIGKEWMKEMRAEIDAWLRRVTHACLEKKEPAPEKIESVAEPREVPERATD
jgi:hypothetical protein